VVNSIGTSVRYDRIGPLGLYHTQARERLETVREDRVKQASAGVYAENGIQWTDTVRSILGLRYDRYRFDVQSDDARNSGKLSAGITSPKAGVVWRAAQKVELFANAGRGFHSNDARVSTIAIDPATGEAAERVTPLVRTKGAEVGLRIEPAPGLQSSLALWRLDIDSELLFAGDAGTTEASRPSKRRGIEWSNHYTVSPQVLLDLDVAVSRARFADGDPAGDRIPGSVETVISAGLALNDLGPWSGSLQLRYFGPRALVEDGSVRSASTTLFNARVGYRLARDWKLTLDVLNLFDREASDIDYFYESRLRGEPEQGVADAHFHPVEPRTVRLTLSARF
jgi:outer membrane receptor protein involved in Fe transport